MLAKIRDKVQGTRFKLQVAIGNRQWANSQIREQLNLPAGRQ